MSIPTSLNPEEVIENAEHIENQLKNYAEHPDMMNDANYWRKMALELVSVLSAVNRATPINFVDKRRSNYTLTDKAREYLACLDEEDQAVKRAQESERNRTRLMAVFTKKV